MCRRPRIWGLEQSGTCDLGPNESSCVCRAIIQALLGFVEVEEALSCEHGCGGSTGSCQVALFRGAGEGGRRSSWLLMLFVITFSWIKYWDACLSLLNFVWKLLQCFPSLSTPVTALDYRAVFLAYWTECWTWHTVSLMPPCVLIRAVGIC